MKYANLIAGALLLMGSCWGAHARDVEIENHPGYINLEDIEIPDACESVTDISLGQALLALAWKSSGKDGDEGSAKLLSIRVKSYESDSLDMVKLQPIIDRIERKLKKEKWEQIVHVLEGDERTTVSVKQDDGKILGLFVMSIEPDSEVVFVNIVGSFDLDDLNRFDLGLDLDQSALDSLRKSAGD